MMDDIWMAILALRIWSCDAGNLPTVRSWINQHFWATCPKHSARSDGPASQHGKKTRENLATPGATTVYLWFLSGDFPCGDHDPFGHWVACEWCQLPVAAGFPANGTGGEKIKTLNLKNILQKMKGNLDFGKCGSSERICKRVILFGSCRETHRWWANHLETHHWPSETDWNSLKSIVKFIQINPFH